MDPKFCKYAGGPMCDKTYRYNSSKGRIGDLCPENAAYLHYLPSENEEDSITFYCHQHMSQMSRTVGFDNVYRKKDGVSIPECVIKLAAAVLDDCIIVSE